MTEPSSRRLICGAPSPFYRRPGAPAWEELRDLCVKRVGHPGPHQWLGYRESLRERPA